MSFYVGLLKEINSCRQNPSLYADKILALKPYFKDKIFKPPGSKVGIGTQEGFEAFEEAAKVLKSSKPVGELIPSKALNKIAGEYLETVSHVEPENIDQIDVNLIIKKYGSFTGVFNNAIDFGSTTPELVLISLIVSDGDSTRYNREFIINPESKKVGLANGNHDSFGTLTVVVTCEDFINTIDKDDTEDYGGLLAAGSSNENNEAKNVDPNAVSSSKEDEFKVDDPNIAYCSRRERIVIDSGVKKKKTIIFKKFKDGKVKKEVFYRIL